MSNDLRFRATMDDKVSGPLDRMKDKFDLLGKSKGAQSILGGVGLAAGEKAAQLLGQALGGVGDIIGGAIQKASDLEETLSKVDIVFGSSAATVNKWGDTAATSLGLSKQAAEEAAASIGNLLLSTGTAPAKIAPMSTSIVKLAADLGAFNNIGTDEALKKLQSGLVGQERPLRELGVAISAASVDSEALALGFKKVNGQFTEGEKVQARYALIFQQTATAQGNFALTSGNLAEKQKILNALLDDEAAKLGKKLEPAVNDATSAQISAVTGLDRFLSVMTLVSDKTNATADDYRNFADINKILANAAGPLGPIFKSNATAADATADAMDNSAKAALNSASGFNTVGKAADDMREPVATAAKVEQDLAAATTLARIAMDKAAPKVRDYFNEFKRSGKGTKGDVSQARLDILDAAQAVRDAQKAMEKATPGTAAYKRAQLELDVAQGILADDTQFLNDKLSTAFLLHPNERTRKELKHYFDSIGLSVLGLSGDALLAYERLNPLLHLSIPQTLLNQKPPPGGKPGNIDKPGKAGGGYVGPGWSGAVGELGEEHLTMFVGGGGYVSKHSGGGNSGAPTVIHTHVHLDGHEIAVAISEDQYFDLSRSSHSGTRA